MIVFYTGLDDLNPWGYKFHFFLNNCSLHIAVTEMGPTWSVSRDAWVISFQKHLNNPCVNLKMLTAYNFLKSVD